MDFRLLVKLHLEKNSLDVDTLCVELLFACFSGCAILRMALGSILKVSNETFFPIICNFILFLVRRGKGDVRLLIV